MTQEARGAMPLVDAIVEDERWQDVGVDALAERAARSTLRFLGAEPADHEISLLAADDARLMELNSAFRGRDRPTNVLSWPSGEPVSRGSAGKEPVFLGDLALAYETCRNEASAADRPFGNHVTHLVVHGVLHLLGYDHEDKDEAEAMEDIEVKILASLGVENPYI
jgi:probable rRNA maturation factor